MRILVIGNGFDLDHNLPTSYKDFLNFCEYVIVKSKNENTELTIKENQNNYYLNMKAQKHLKEFEHLVISNYILQYFIRINRDNNWIDFENEIKIIIDCFVDFEKEFLLANKTKYYVSGDDKIVVLCEKLNIQVFKKNEFSVNDFVINEKRLKELFFSLFDSIERITKALELYISEFIDSESINSFSPDVADYSPDKVISFNYSSTYERFYSLTNWRASVDYIHGKAKGYKKCTQPNGIVLGITSSVPVESDYIYFEKYYQRITKKTGAKYKEWLRDDKQRIEIAFFGHSLDSSDKDILIDLIEAKNSFITIYYHSDSAYKTIIENLNRLLGKEKLIQYVYGNTPKIVFLRQREACNSKSGGWEIKRDISSIRQLYRFDERTTNVIIKRITENINKENLEYFYSQENLITLVDAISWKKITRIIDKNKILQICNKLDYKIKDDCLVEFSIDDWKGLDYNGELIHQEFTRELIDEINEQNKKRYQSKSKKGISYKIRNLEIEKDKTVYELLPSIIEIITDNSFFDSNQFSYQLINACEENKTILLAIRELSINHTFSIFLEVKAKIFLDIYDEFKYYDEMQKSLYNE